MKQMNYKKLIIPNIPYVFFVYLFDKVGQAVRLAPGADISEKILNITQGFSEAFSNALPSVHPLDLLIGIVGAVVIRLIVYVKGKNAKKYRKGAEYGSARWGNAEDIKPYIDPDFQNNIILTQTERLTMNSRPKQPKYARNKNVVVIGGSGSGKTRFFVKPNLMQLHSSYVLTDPKGTVLIECGKLLQRGGYKIKVLNTINFKKSMRYNPFVYIRSEKDVLKVVNVDLENFNLSHVPVYIMGEEQLSMYAMYMSSLGNRPDLFPSSGYVSKYYENPPADYEVPAALLNSDEQFARLIEEADKYVGFPYVWGGSTPETSFDCSGFVSYVLTNSGLYNTGRLGAQGLYNISTRVSNPQPGDLVFFTGTYDTPGVSHVGIYVGEDGDGSPVMLHCGDPIQYAKLDTSYWQSHFYAYGRLHYN